MKFSRCLASFAITVLALGGLNASANESSKEGLEFLDQLGWFKQGAQIQELRDSSTEVFELLDENNSGSITLDEIDLTQFETDMMAKMNPAELQQNRQRINAIRSKFMNWSEEIDEFEVVDTNSDGYWSEEEYEARRENLNLHRLELGIKQWDTDENGAVELHEFNSHLDELEMLDEDGDGTVSREEAFKSKNSHVITDVLKQQLHTDGTIMVGGPTLLKTLPEGAVSGGVHMEVIHRKTEVEESKKE
ncbi:MAG: hypothetical protein F4227_04215 [Gammaproteobacteria bacterium]|nr:hypothetical protein [Gammaproteobacteria bacterium]MYF02180.1 hypothetical protein [Gammaproteobacteria bacterium]MYI78007.1 hypothetical protein [Gammaproteobacteria bacterium]